MGNMSYCRFENTSGDLIDCQEAIENGEMSVEMSEYEREGLEIILNCCEEIYHMSDEIRDALKRWDDNDEQMKREEEEELERIEEEKRLAEEERQANLTDEEIETENTSTDIKKIVLEVLSGCPETSSPQYKLLNNLRQFKQ
tara:strand:- start:639 stop:1064 length:426 start_codon:yes stop_codon:yes gene_type:complete